MVRLAPKAAVPPSRTKIALVPRPALSRQRRPHRCLGNSHWHRARPRVFRHRTDVDSLIFGIVDTLKPTFPITTNPIDRILVEVLAFMTSVPTYREP